MRRQIYAFYRLPDVEDCPIETHQPENDAMCGLPVRYKANNRGGKAGAVLIFPKKK